MQAVNNQAPVTALRFVDENHLLAGSGSFLKLYAWPESRVIRVARVFPVDDIHGIHLFSPDRRTAVVWGGRSLTVVDTLRLDVLSKMSCKDRIVDARVDADGALNVFTAHNEVLVVDLESFSTRATLRCPSRSILYSGTLSFVGERRLAAAGTVFGGVVVWDLETQQITHTFETHDGSIFDVAFSDDGRLLASCSDDRAIFVHNLEQNQCVAEGWGHVARIWRLQFFGENALISVGEDCSARVWALQTGSRDLRCDRILQGHHGRSVWSIDIFNRAVAATGGGDGKIMLWDLAPSPAPQTTQIGSVFGSAVRSVAISADGTIAATTVRGDFFLREKYDAGAMEAAEAAEAGWHRIDDLGLSGVAIVKSWGNLFFVVSGEGRVVNTHGATVQKFNCGGEKVLDFFVLSECAVLIVPTPPATHATYIDTTGSGRSVKLRVPTRSGVMTCAAHCGDHGLCIGTRKGDLLVFKPFLESDEPVCVRPRALSSKSDAVTQLLYVSGTMPYLIATSRSAEYGWFKVPDLEELGKTRARKRGSIEGCALSSQGLLLWGFQKDLFVASNVGLGNDFAAIDCGGAHRSWAAQSVGNNSIVFAYVRGTELAVHRIPLTSDHFAKSLVQQGTHGREIRGLEACPSNKSLIATGSEDTCVRLGWLLSEREREYERDEPGGQLPQLSTNCVIHDGHVSGIQCLHWTPSGKYLLTGAGQGELVMWRVEAPEVGGDIFASEAGRMPVTSGGMRELRVMDFSVVDDLIAVAYSDSSFRVWRLPMWELVAESRYHECCLLNIDLVSFLPAVGRATNESVDDSEVTSSRMALLISSTDGHLVVYYLHGSSVELKLRQQVHQSSIRSSCIIENADRSLSYFSGGDDNSVCGSSIKLLADSVEYKLLFRNKSAHASAVTSVRPVPNSTHFATTGSDQKFKVWDCTDGIELGATFTSISDTGVMIWDNDVVLAGIGIEYFRVPK